MHSDILLETDDVGVSDFQSHDSTIRQTHKGIHDLEKLGQMPFLEVSHQHEHIQDILTLVEQKKQDFDTLLVLGIGGSALGTRFLIESLAYKNLSRFVLCDHVDPDSWHLLQETLDFKKTLIVVVSKSGRTIETLAAFVYFQNILKQRVADYQKHFLIITDPREGILRKLAQEEGFASLEVPSGVGGRYSVLTSVGLFPAAFLNVDIQTLLLGGKRMIERCQHADPWTNPALLSALIHWEHAKKGRKMRAMFPYGERLKSFAPWFAQLWAESLGKKYSLKGDVIHTGTTALCNLGPADQHSQLQLYLEGPDDKVVTFIGVENSQCRIHLPETPLVTNGIPLRNLSISALQSAERQATEQALSDVGRPHQTILLRHVDPYTVGQLILMAELETVYSGALYDINPFDQPAVELIKKNIPNFI